MNKLTLLVAALALVITFTSCSKQGDPGPAGPAGKDGIKGTDGTNGTNGKDGKDGVDGTNGTNGTNGTDGKDGVNGKDGNANVIGSDPFTTIPGNWTAGGGGSYYTATFTANIITQAIADKGAVLCYQKLTNGAWLPLPSGYYTYYFTAGNLEIFYGDAVNPGAQTFRIVAISSSELARNPDLDLKDYASVVKRLRLAE